MQQSAVQSHRLYLGVSSLRTAETHPLAQAARAETFRIPETKAVEAIAAAALNVQRGVKGGAGAGAGAGGDGGETRTFIKGISCPKKARDMIGIWKLSNPPRAFQDVILDAVCRAISMPKGSAFPYLVQDGIKRMSTYIWYNYRDLVSAWMHDAQGSVLSRPIHTTQLADVAVVCELVRLSRKQRLVDFPWSETESKLREIQLVETALFGHIVTPASTSEHQNCMVCGDYPPPPVEGADTATGWCTQAQYSFPEGKVQPVSGGGSSSIHMRRCISCDGFVCTSCESATSVRGHPSIASSEEKEEEHAAKRARIAHAGAPAQSERCLRCNLFVCLYCVGRPVSYFGKEMPEAQVQSRPFVNTKTRRICMAPLCGHCARSEQKHIDELKGSRHPQHGSTMSSPQATDRVVVRVDGSFSAHRNQQQHQHQPQHQSACIQSSQGVDTRPPPLPPLPPPLPLLPPPPPPHPDMIQQHTAPLTGTTTMVGIFNATSHTRADRAQAYGGEGGGTQYSTQQQHAHSSRPSLASMHDVIFAFAGLVRS